MKIRISSLRFPTCFPPVPCSCFAISAPPYLGFRLLLLNSFKSSRYLLTNSNPSTVSRKFSTKSIALTPPSKMSYSNTDTGDKPADPYKAKNLDEPSLKEKVEALSTFISNSKFGMLTTRIEGSKLLTSRAMGVAAQVGFIFPPCTHWSIFNADPNSSVLCRKLAASISSSTPTQNQARPTTSKPTLRSMSPS